MKNNLKGEETEDLVGGFIMQKVPISYGKSTQIINCLDSVLLYLVLFGAALFQLFWNVGTIIN